MNRFMKTAAAVAAGLFLVAGGAGAAENHDAHAGSAPNQGGMAANADGGCGMGQHAMGGMQGMGRHAMGGMQGMGMHGAAADSAATPPAAGSATGNHNH